MAFEKGHKKAGGRKPGSLNKATESIKNLLNGLLPEDRLRSEWNTISGTKIRRSDGKLSYSRTLICSGSR